MKYPQDSMHWRHSLTSSAVHRFTRREIYEKMGRLPAYEGFVEYGGGDACIIGPNGKILTEKLPKNARDWYMRI